MPGQMWQTDADGGYLYADELSRDLRMELLPMCKFRQLNDAVDFTKKGKKKGDTVHWDVFTRVATRGTTLTEGTAMPETKFTVFQGTATVDEWGNSVHEVGAAFLLAA